MSNFEQKQALNSKELHLLQTEFEQSKKSGSLAWLFMIFLSGLGIHHFYLNKPLSGIGYLTLNFLGWLTVWIFIGYFFWFILGVWWIIDLFFINANVRTQNERIESSIIERILRNRDY